MKKNLLIVFLLFVSAACLVYAVIQKTEAKKSEMRAAESERRALEANIKYEEQMKRAEQAMIMSEVMRADSEKKNKK